ncbi:2-hydroxy-3-keto-5-methylthiopentenyl-1-phosphate phosphatase [Paenibacillus yanchengensis]|uniref:2-hydroxy-3-keto-5-methylthiopentenyl-1-phosphate phosphatase n=1 Tax=Paenibacillus yanchengensis TaxID=2035833 RepID=A0ABW4YJU7_9BACL
MSKQQVIFCDFDGTITINDNIIAIIQHFDPPGWKAIATKVLDTSMTIKEGVGLMFHLLPSSMQQEVIDFSITNVEIRDGFAEFVQYCNDNNIILYVTSGGIDFFVYPTLARYNIDTAHIYCNGSNFAGDTIEITWPHPCDEHCQRNCGMCKPTIMRQFPTEQYNRIVIGDSVTDFEAAKLADKIYSRARLTEQCAELNLPYTDFATFHDIIAEMEREK